MKLSSDKCDTYRETGRDQQQAHCNIEDGGGVQMQRAVKMTPE